MTKNKKREEGEEDQASKPHHLGDKLPPTIGEHHEFYGVESRGGNRVRMKSEMESKVESFHVHAWDVMLSPEHLS